MEVKQIIIITLVVDQRRGEDMSKLHTGLAILKQPPRKPGITLCHAFKLPSILNQF